MKRLIPLLILLSLAGCGTVLNMAGGNCLGGEKDIYGGIQFDGAHLLRECPSWTALLGVIDFPFSLVGDTLTLPWTIAKAFREPPRDPFETDREKMTAPRRRED